MDYEKTKENIRNFLQDKINNKVITQAELAAKLGISKATVNKWMVRGSIPNAEYILEICKILNCTPYEMYGEVNPNVLTDEEKHAVELYRNNRELFKAIENAKVGK